MKIRNKLHVWRNVYEGEKNEGNKSGESHNRPKRVTKKIDKKKSTIVQCHYEDNKWISSI